MNDPLGTPRCSVCALPLPRGLNDGVCSRRCSGRRTAAAHIRADAMRLEARIQSELRGLSKGATMCPGELARRVLPDVPEPLTILRPLLFLLNERGAVALSQKGVLQPWWKIRGPFRIRAR